MCICKRCEAKINEGEAKMFTVCDECWEKRINEHVDKQSHQVEMATERIVELFGECCDIPMCNNSGDFISINKNGDTEQNSCQFCYTNAKSKFNLKIKLNDLLSDFLINREGIYNE